MNKKKIAITIISIVISLILGIGLAFILYLNYIQDQLNNGNKNDEELAALDGILKSDRSIDEPFYIMLLGSDARIGDSTMGERSDTNIVVRVDPIENIITMVSIPRDTKIQLPGHGTQKFNAAYAFDGAPGAIKAANELLGIEISYYAEVNFETLMELVDTLGGVEIDVDVKIDDWKADYNASEQHNVIEPGYQTLNGQQALSFARSRAFADGDFTRQLHQRMVIEAIISKVLSAPITDIPGIVQDTSRSITTNLSISEIIALIDHFKDSEDMTIYSCMVPSTTAYINRTSYVINNHEATMAMMEIVNAGGDPNTLDISLYPDVVVTGEGVEKAPGSMDYEFDYIESNNYNKPSNNNSTNNSNNTSNTTKPTNNNNSSTNDKETNDQETKPTTPAAPPAETTEKEPSTSTEPIEDATE